MIKVQTNLQAIKRMNKRKSCDNWPLVARNSWNMALHKMVLKMFAMFT
jgi:hypothetical protein